MNKPKIMTLNILALNKSGVLEEMVSPFRRRGFNIKSIFGSCAKKNSFLKITIAVEIRAGFERQFEQAIKQVGKLIVVFRLKRVPA